MTEVPPAVLDVSRRMGEFMVRFVVAIMIVGIMVVMIVVIVVIVAIMIAVVVVGIVVVMIMRVNRHVVHFIGVMKIMMAVGQRCTAPTDVLSNWRMGLFFLFVFLCAPTH